MAVSQLESSPVGSGRRLSARSVVASTLLGTHPPRLPGALLVALASKFGIAPGTTRVALSRMVDKGELTNTDGRYALAGHLLDRQRRQDSSIDADRRPWSGTWEQVIAVETADAGRRTARRTSLRALKLAALREGVWMRPANLDPDRLPHEVCREGADLLWGTVELAGDDAALASQLWDLDGWAARAQDLVAALRASSAQLAADDEEGLAAGFELSAATLRHFVADPELPHEVLPPGWPDRALRGAYAAFDDAYRSLLRRFFAAHCA